MYLRPKSLGDAIDALAGGGLVVAGGTDVYPALVDRPPPERVVDLSAVEELRRIDRSVAGFRIGAGVTWTDVIRADLPPAFDGLKAAAREVGSVQIQNRATVAGNLCNASPAADGAPPLLALDARVELAGTDGTRDLPLDRFLLGNRRTAREPGEIVTAVIVPPHAAATGSSFLKLGSRRYLVISIVMVGATIALDDAGNITGARIAVGSSAVTALRLTDLEAAVAGLAGDVRPSSRLQPGHLAPLAPIDDVRASAEYRLDAALDLVARAMDAAWTSAGARHAG